MAEANQSAASGVTGASPEPPTIAGKAATLPAPKPAPSPAIPVALNEAALDSPSFRAMSAHFGEQVDMLERWLDNQARTTAKLTHDVLAVEESVNSYLAKIMPPPAAIDGVLDNDYTILALRRASEGNREWWGQILGAVRRMETVCVDPLRAFLGGELRTFREVRRALEASQKTFDANVARYVAQSKAKEPSALREDAFALYETRKAYLKAAMDYCQLAPQIRAGLDRLLVRVCSDVWREMRKAREARPESARWGEEMERIRGWSREMEASESVFRREVQIARREIGESTLAAFRPSRELDDYSASTVAMVGAGRGPASVQRKGGAGAVISEKQGWLFLRTVSGKPVRYNWVRRWYYCKDGIFGWLVQGPQGVLQGDEIGVLMISAKPAAQEERRFCFEVKTKSQTILLQAETQTQLTEWLEVFEVAKKHAFEVSMSRDSSALPGGVDPAFAITTPSIPEFSAKSIEGLDDPSVVDRISTLPIPGPGGDLTQRASFDVAGTAPRRSVTALGREEGESSRDQAARIMQRLDLHRKAPFTSAADTGGNAGGGGGIASLISASQMLGLGYSGTAPVVPATGAAGKQTPATAALSLLDPRPGSLAPATLAKPPINTTLGKAAIVASAELATGSNATSRVPTGVVANYWGSSPWGTLYGATSHATHHPGMLPTPYAEDDPFISQTTITTAAAHATVPSEPAQPAPGHKKTQSMDTAIPTPKSVIPKAVETFPANYPVELKAQHAQFRLLFPSVPLDEKLVLVFNAAWTSSTEENSASTGLAGNGRIYVTPDNMYFYGHQMGPVIAYTIPLDIITEVTAAPGRDNDFIFIHLGQNMNDTGYVRITIKTFLEDLRLLHARLNFLVDDLQAEEPLDLPELVAALIDMEAEEGGHNSPTAESWEEVSSNTPADNGTLHGRPVSHSRHRGAGPQSHTGRKLHRHGHGHAVPAFQLPAHPVFYEPEDMQKRVSERHFEISAKACFHVLFGDKSFIFPKMYFDRQAKEIAQGPWTLGANGGAMNRQFTFRVEYVDMLGRSKPGDVRDTQTIDVFSDHVTYVVSYVKTPWHLPHSSDFKLVLKIVITHIAKSKCKLAIYTKVDWSASKTPSVALAKGLVQRQALDDAARDAEELAEVATDQVRKLGPHSRTKRAIQVYGGLGQQSDVVIFSPNVAAEGGDASAAPAATGGTGKTVPQQRTIGTLLLETVRSFMESVITSVMMWAFAGVKNLFSIATANRVILGLMLLSVLYNLIITSQVGANWWTERKAVKYMQRMGIGPHGVMGRALWLRDLEEVARPGALELGGVGDSCYDTFAALLNTTDMDASPADASSVLTSPASRAAARRLRRTRQRLGSYRHDLVVAMRVVNSIEREMVASEWENWLADEVGRCEAAGRLLELDGSTQKEGKSAKKEKVGSNVSESQLQRVKDWHGEYCASCRKDWSAVAQRGGAMGF